MSSSSHSDISQALLATLTLLITGSLMLFILPEPVEGGTLSTWNEVEQELQELANSYPNLTALQPLGTTWQNRTIWSLRIFDEEYLNQNSTDPSNLTASSDPALLFLAAHHGDEKQGVDLTLDLARKLLEGYGTDDNLTALLRARDIWIVPVANPDGYEHDTRKNGRDNDLDDEFDPDVDGVDLNRNFGHEWGVDGHTSDSSNSEFYHGPGPFSEPETMALAQQADTINFSAAISFHSGTARPVIYYPWGWNDSLQVPGDELADFTAVAANMSRLTGYDNGQATNTSLGGYEARGDLVDWLYANHSTLAYTVELPGIMTAEHTEANLEAAWWLLARPWGNETEGPLDNWTEPEPEPLPDVWVEEINSNAALMVGDQANIMVRLVTSSRSPWPQPKVPVTFLVNDAVHGTLNISLESDGNATVTFAWVPEKAGAYVIEVIVDPENIVDETDEENNRFGYPITVEPRSDSAEGLLPGIGIHLLLVAMVVVVAGRRKRS